MMMLLIAVANAVDSGRHGNVSCGSRSSAAMTATMTIAAAAAAAAAELQHIHTPV